MSPLVRSLLALAALFATATTQPLPPNCTQKTFGQVTNYPIPLVPVQVPPPGAIVDIRDYCPSGLKRVGETVLACNNSGPTSQAPLVYEQKEGDLELVAVMCVDGCPLGVTVTVTEYCGPAPPQ